MRVRFPILVFSLFVCLRAQGALAVSYAAGSFTITVPAGHTVAWIGEEKGTSGSAKDADGDGTVVVPTTWAQGQYAFVDVDAGEWAVHNIATTVPAQPLPDGTIVRGRNGEFSQLIVFSYSYGASALWVRPGVGAWTPPRTALKDADNYQYNNLLFDDATTMTPIGASPATPSGFARGDRLVILHRSGGLPSAGIVDPFLDAPASGGAISFVLPDLATVNEGATHAVLLMRTNGADGTVTVRCRTVATTAVAGIDFVAMDQIVSFAPGEVLKSVQVATIDDAFYAAEWKRFALVLSDPSGARLGTIVEYQMGIQDNDPRPQMRLGELPATLLEGDVTWTLNVPVTVTGVFRDTLATPLDVSDSGPTTQTRIPLTFLPGETRKDVGVTIFADDVPNSLSRELILRLAEGADVKFLTIVDDDTPTAITVSNVTVQETTGPPAIAAFRIELSPPPETSVTFDVQTADGTATAGADYLPLHRTVTFAAGQAQGTVDVEVVGDSLDESDETFRLRVSNAVGAYLLDSFATATIVDDDGSAPEAVWIEPVSVSEGSSGQHPVDVRVRLGVALTAPLTLDIATTPGSAASSVDYQPISQSITFAPGQTDVVVKVMIVGDVIEESNENFFVTAREGATLRATGVVTIVDDDALPVLSVSDPWVTEQTGTSTFVVFRVAIRPNAQRTVNVAYATEDGTALAGADYLAASGVLSFRDIDGFRDVRVEVFGDAVTEDAETLTLRLSVPDGGASLANATATATIVDDDVAAASTSVADIEVRESDGVSEATFTVTLSNAMTAPVTVSYSTFEHTASPARDYEETSGSVTFAPGETSRPVTVRIVGDREAEPRETFRLRLLSSDGAPIDDGTALCTIVDDDTMTKRRTLRH